MLKWSIVWNTASSRQYRKQTLTKRHLTGFAQLAVLTPLHLLIREDFLQRPRQKHALRFTVFCLWMRVLLRCQMLLLLHVSVLLPLLFSGRHLRPGPANKQVTRKANESQAISVSPAELLPQPSAAMMVTRHVTWFSAVWTVLMTHNVILTSFRYSRRADTLFKSLR